MSPLAEWYGEIETESPIYFWNRIVFHVYTHRHLDTQEYGPLLLKAPGQIEPPEPCPDTTIGARAILGIVLNSIDPARMPTKAEIEAFFTPGNSQGPKTLYLPEVVSVVGCGLWPKSAKRWVVRLWAHLPEAVPYVDEMLRTQGYYEVTRQPEKGLDVEEGHKPSRQGAHGDTLTRVKDARRQTQVPRIPNRAKDLRRWKAIWAAVAGQWRHGKSYTDLLDWLNRVHPELQTSEKTLSDICEAGEAGLLD